MKDGEYMQAIRKEILAVTIGILKGVVKEKQHDQHDEQGTQGQLQKI